MNLANFGAVRHSLLSAAVLAFLAASVSAQIVEKERTFADLTASHPCSSGYTGRNAIVTDCDAADDIGDGGGAFRCFAHCDGTAPWEAVSIGGGAGGGTGDVVGPASSTDNGIVRFDATTGKLVQTSNLTLSDVSGVTTTLATITPAATTGATVAGQALEITASPAVASTDTAGAAAGGSVTITAGAAARNASGNANGGNINLVTGAGIGTGTAGQVLHPIGTVGVPGIAFTGDSDTGISGNGSNFILFSTAGVQRAYIYSGALNIEGSLQYAVSLDVGWARDAAGIWRASDASTGLGWVKEDGKFALGSDFTNATATMENLTGLTATLKAGRKYTFRMVLRFSDSVAGEGVKFDFDGGAGTATDFGVNCQVFDSALLLSSDATALATDFAIATATGASKAVCDGSFTVNAAGTFIPRAAQNSHSTGTLTVETGSYLHLTDTSFN